MGESPRASSWLLASPWLSSGCCGHLGREPAERGSLPLSFHKNYKINIFKVIKENEAPQTKTCTHVECQHYRYWLYQLCHKAIPIQQLFIKHSPCSMHGKLNGKPYRRKCTFPFLKSSPSDAKDKYTAGNSNKPICCCINRLRAKMQDNLENACLILGTPKPRTVCLDFLLVARNRAWLTESSNFKFSGSNAFTLVVQKEQS